MAGGWLILQGQTPLHDRLSPAVPLPAKGGERELRASAVEEECPC